MSILKQLTLPILFMFLPFSLVAQAPSNPPPGTSVDVIEQTIRPPSLLPVYVTESDNKQVRELQIPLDATYKTLTRTLVSYLDGESPTEAKRTLTEWNELVLPAGLKTNQTKDQLRESFVADSRKLTFNEYQTRFTSARKLMNATSIKDSFATEMLFIPNFRNKEIIVAEKRLATRVATAGLKNLNAQQLIDRQSASFAIGPGGVIIAMKMLQDAIDKALDRADAIMTSQLFALRSHLAASIQDMNVVFRDRLNQTFDKLTEREQVAINAALNISYDAQTALEDLQNGASQAAANLLCKATIALGQFSILSIFKKTPPPDILCLETPHVRDRGTLHEGILIFDGVSLRKGGDYPNVSVIVPTAQKSFDVPAGGGNTVLQVPMPGGINGGPNDTQPRGTLTAIAQFDWNHDSQDKSKLKLRWLFSLEPYLVNSIDVSITPQIRQTTYGYKSERFYLEAEERRKNSATWTLPVDNGGEVIDCWYEETNRVGYSGVDQKLLTAGACQVTAHAEGQERFKGGGSYGIIMHIKEKFQNDIAGPTWREIAHIVNQPQKEVIFSYDKKLLPPESKVIDYDFDWTVDIHRNTEENFILTTSQKEDKRIGVATMDLNGNLTVKFRDSTSGGT